MFHMEDCYTITHTLHSTHHAPLSFYNREQSEPGLVRCCDLISPTHILPIEI